MRGRENVHELGAGQGLAGCMKSCKNLVTEIQGSI